MAKHADLTGALLHPPGDHGPQHEPGEPDGLEAYYSEVGHDHDADYSALAHDHDADYADISVRSPVYAKVGANVWYAGWGNGDPGPLFTIMSLTNLISVTPDAMCTTSFNRSRCVRFRLPRALELTDVQVLGASASTGGMWKLAIYPEAGGAYLWASAAFDTAANDWGGPSGITGITLLADTDYLLCALSTASSATTSIKTHAPPANINYHKIGGPLDAPGQGFAIYKEFIVATPGTFDATLPTLVTLSANNGAPPMAILKGTGS